MKMTHPVSFESGSVASGSERTDSSGRPAVYAAAPGDAVPVLTGARRRVGVGHRATAYRTCSEPLAGAVRGALIGRRCWFGARRVAAARLERRWSLVVAAGRWV